MNTFEQLIASLHKVALSRSEKDAMRMKLQEHMKENPVQVSIGEVVRHQVGQGSLYSGRNKKTTMITSIIIALFLSGSISYAAEGSVPGDTLYPIKTQMNERVKSAITIGAEGEAKLEARFARERLEEAEELATSGKLSSEQAIVLGARFEEHAKSAEEHVAKLESQGELSVAKEVNADIAIMLREHEMILSKLILTDGEVTVALTPLVEKVQIEASAREEQQDSILRSIEHSLDATIDLDGSAGLQIEGESKSSGDAQVDGRMESDDSESDEGKTITIDGALDVNTDLNVSSGGTTGTVTSGTQGKINLGL